MEYSYLIRHGLMGQVGRFAALWPDLERGQTVVVRTHRGTELGSVLVADKAESAPSSAGASVRVLRVAGPDDLERARRVDRDRPRRFVECQRVFEDGVWPLELIDVEPLLDDRRTILHYLGPHRLDVSGLVAAFEARCGLDVLLEPVGPDVPVLAEPESEPAAPSGCGSCGSGGGCGSSGGGCGSEADGAPGSCSDCGVKKLLSARSPGSRR